MKKLLPVISMTFGFLIINTAYAADDLCLKLTNSSETPIQFFAPSAGMQPTIEPNQSMVIGSDYTGCLSNSKVCTVSIQPTNSTSKTTIKNVPPGSRIIYFKPDQYAINGDARVKCSS